LTESIVIEEMYNGPPGSGNGGYASGRIAALLGDGQAEVTLRMPVPLGRPMRVERENGVVRVYDGEGLVAEATPSGTDVLAGVPDAPALEEALVASKRYAGFGSHPFKTCFACGTERAEPGLRIFAGPLSRDHRAEVAAPWTPTDDFSVDGVAREEIVWAALDCPGGWAMTDHSPGREAVLGRMTARVLWPVRAGEPHVVLGWLEGVDGRKAYAGSAVFSQAGELCAAARCTWILIQA
jgi:hypothetical protein